MHHGWDGYTEMTRSIVRAADTVRAAIDKIDGISVLGDSKLCILAFTSERFHVYKVADEMKVRALIISNLHLMFHILYRNTVGCFLVSRTPTQSSCTWCRTC